MARNTQISDAAANAAVNALLALANGGTLKIYNGTQPANANTAVTSQSVLATINLNNPAFGNAVGGSASMNSVVPASISSQGTASWFRIYKSDGTTAVLDGNIGVTGSGSNLEFGSTSFQSGAQVSVTSYTYSIVEAGN